MSEPETQKTQTFTVPLDYEGRTAFITIPTPFTREDVTALEKWIHTISDVGLERSLAKMWTELSKEVQNVRDEAVVRGLAKFNKETCMLIWNEPKASVKAVEPAKETEIK